MCTPDLQERSKVGISPQNMSNMSVENFCSQESCEAGVPWNISEGFCPPSLIPPTQEVAMW